MLIFQYKTGSGGPLDISGATYNSNNMNVGSQEGTATGVTIKGDGTKAYVVGTTGEIHQYGLTTAFDISSGSYDSVQASVVGATEDPLGLYITPDGLNLYVPTTLNDVRHYEMSVAWDLSTLSFNGLMSTTSGAGAFPTGVAVSSDGTKLYVLGQTTDTLAEHSMSTPYDITTANATPTDTFSVASQIQTPQDLAFTPDGKHVIVMDGDTPADVRQYDLSTAWDLTTIAYASKLALIGSEESIPLGVTLNHTEKKMWMVGNANDRVFEYDY